MKLGQRWATGGGGFKIRDEERREEKKKVKKRKKKRKANVLRIFNLVNNRKFEERKETCVWGVVRWWRDSSLAKL